MVTAQVLGAVALSRLGRLVETEHLAEAARTCRKTLQRIRISSAEEFVGLPIVNCSWQVALMGQ